MRDKIKLVSTAKTGHYYTTTKNKRTMTEKMVIKKYDPVVRKHVEYKEAKIKQFSDCLIVLRSNTIFLSHGYTVTGAR